MLSNNSDFKKLLLLHSRDRRKLVMDQELENLPRLIEQMESKIKIEKDTIAAAAHELKSLESQNNTIENEINSISEHISRQKNKQLQVKKNEEYQALENEIHNLVQQLSQKEDQQIETLLKIDGAKETTEIAQNKISARVDDLEIEKEELVKKIELLKLDIQKLSLETGSGIFFAPARKLFTKCGFKPCDPFAHYKDDPNSCYMSKLISN